MFASYERLTQLLAAAREVRGRKKLQKMVYIAQQLGYRFAEPFHLHVWGPYSEVLAVKVKEMTEWGFATEQTLPGPAGNVQYVYTPGPNAGRVCTEFDPQLGRLVQHLNSQDSTFLEGVATALFLRGQGRETDQVTAMLGRLKPDKFAGLPRASAVIAFAEALEEFRPA